MLPSTHITTLTLIALFFCAPISWAKDITTSAQIDRSSVAVGKAAVLNVTINGDNHAEVDIPEIDGLFIQDRGHSSNIEIRNGHMNTSITRRYVVIPSKVGDYTIGPITITSGGKKQTIQNPPKIKATKGIAPGKPNAAQGANQPAPALNAKDLAKLEIIGLKKEAIVGELIPIKIRAYFKHNNQTSLSQILSKPSLDSSAFTLKIDAKKPRQGHVTLNGEPYYVFVFDAAISPIKPGDYEVPFEMEASLRIQVKSKRPRRSNDPFNDPFFNSFFSRSVSKNITLTSDPFTIKVSPAPTENQPDGFDGAIGKFSINATAPTTPIRAGDPLTLTVRVTGSGNLSRVSPPHMADGSGWKTYPPKHHLEDANSLGTSGTKVFEQTIVPRNTSVKEIPAMELVYFDPEKQTYQTARTLPIPIQILPGTDIAEKSATDNTNASQPDQTNEPAWKQLSPASHLGWLRKSRLDTSTPFLITTTSTTAAFLVFAAGLAWVRNRNTSERKAATAKEREIQSCLKHMDEAITSRDTATFFLHARRAVQLRASDPLKMQPNAITATDLPVGSDARSVLEMADTLSFSGESTDAIDLQKWKTRVQ